MVRIICLECSQVAVVIVVVVTAAVAAADCLLEPRSRQPYIHTFTVPALRVGLQMTMWPTATVNRAIGDGLRQPCMRVVNFISQVRVDVRLYTGL